MSTTDDPSVPAETKPLIENTDKAVAEPENGIHAQSSSSSSAAAANENPASTVSVKEEAVEATTELKEEDAGVVTDAETGLQRTTTDVEAPVKSEPVEEIGKADEEDPAAKFLKDTFETFATKQQSTPQKPASPLDILRERTQRDRRDGDAWLGLIDDAMARADLAELRRIYADFFEVFPNAARQWQDYASVELSHSEFSNVEAIFTKCLRTTASTDLWRLYLSYTRRINPLPPANAPEAERESVRKTIEGAYEFALKFIGHSRDAGEVWREYIEFLKQRETGNQWQAGQKMDDIRRTYQRAVAIPLMNVEQLWREYDGYENSLNRITAKKFLGDRSAAYMTARSVLREMRPLTDSLQRPVLPRVPCWAIAPSLDPVVTPMTIVRDRHGVELWKRYLKWEEGDPLQLNNDDGDEKAYQTRVLMAYRKASMHMRFYPEIWYLAANFLHRHDRIEEARQWLENGLSACPGSALLTFAIVEAGERHQQNSGSSDRFNALLDWIHKEIDQLHVQLEEKIRSVDLEAEQAKEAIRLRKNDEGATEELEGEEREEARKLEEQREQKRTAERDLVRPKVDELKEYAALVWIKYMHFIRRTEGQRPSRTIFARARKSKHCTWQVFEANALMEYHCSKDVAVATKVFELALKTFGEDEAFVVRYLEFLLSINDDTNARALFERTVTNFTPERARPIWDRWCDYEYSFGDSASIAKLEDRLAQLYPEEPQTKRLLERNVYMDLDIVGPMDLGLRNTGMAAGGASAAERAVAASREGVQGSGFSTVVSSLPAVSEDGAELGAKRVRLNSDRASATPPPIVGQQQQQTGVRGAVIPKGPRGVKRSVSPPSRFVPPPRGEPGRHAPPMAATQPQSTYLEIPEAILNFMAALPHAHLFDGPRFSANDIVECLLHSNLPSAEAARGGGVAGGVRTGRKGAGRAGRRF